MPTETISTQYLVDGMTCNHCVSSVTEEVSAIDGVESVDIELNVGGSSTVTVLSARALPVEQVREAVTEAGYALAVG